MSARDELAELIRGLDGPATLGGPEVADAILAAGYRKPQTITTAEELDTLGVGTVIRTAKAVVYEKGCFPDEPDLPYWLVTGMNREFAGSRIILPATVLYEPAVTS
jgi:hypothetical protein